MKIDYPDDDIIGVHFVNEKQMLKYIAAREEEKKRDSQGKSTDTTPKSAYELHLLDMSKKDLRFVADILGSEQRAKDFRDGKVTLTELGLTSPVARPKRLSEI